jgi:hypothetical protein
MNLLLAFIAGAFVANAVPHVVSGIAGNSHMTPLSRNSSALVNVVWGYLNWVVGFWLFNYSGGNLGNLVSFDSYSLSFWLGSFVLALTAAWMFSNPKMGFPWFKK